MSISRLCLSDDVDDSDAGDNNSKGFFIKKAKGSRNLLDVSKGRRVGMENWDSLEDDETTYKRIYSRTNHSSSSESPKKKEISWADRIIGSRKCSKHERNDKMKEVDSNKSLIKPNKEKKKDSMRQVTQTSVVYFSKSNSYDGRVIMASRKEGKEKIKDKGKLKKHERKHSKDTSDRQNCMDAALAAAAVRAVVGVTPQQAANRAALPIAYRVKTSLSQSFVVEPLWNHGSQSLEDSDGTAFGRSLAVPEDSSGLDSARSVQHNGIELSFAEPNRPTTASPSQSWIHHHAMVPVPSSNGSSPHTQALALQDELRSPCNLSVNIQLVASNSNLTARALITDGSGTPREIPANISWESNQSKASALSLLDSLNVAKSIEQALAKAVIENAKSLTKLATPPRDVTLEKSTTTACLENTIKAPLLEKSTNTMAEILSELSIERETSVTETSPSRESLPKNEQVISVSDETDSSSLEMLTKGLYEDNLMENNSQKKSGSNISSCEKECWQKELSPTQTVAFLETDLKFKDPACKDNRDRNASLGKATSLEENMTTSQDSYQGGSDTYESEVEGWLKKEDGCSKTERSLEFCEGKEGNTKAGGDDIKEQVLFLTAREVSSKENANKKEMEANFLDEDSKRAVAEGWVAEVSRIVTEKLRARSMIEQRILSQERESIRRRIVMEERKARRERNAKKERAKLEERVALEVRRVLDERSASKDLSPVEEKSSTEDKKNGGMRQTNDFQPEAKNAPENLSIPSLSASKDQHLECKIQNALDHLEKKQSSVSDEQSGTIETDTASSGDHAAGDEENHRRQTSRTRQSTSKHRKELREHKVTEDDLYGCACQKNASVLEAQGPVESKIAVTMPTQWSAEEGGENHQELFVFGEQQQAQEEANGQGVSYDGGAMEQHIGMVPPAPSQGVSQQQGTQQSMYESSSSFFMPPGNPGQDSASNHLQEHSTMSNYQMPANSPLRDPLTTVPFSCCSNMNVTSNYYQYPPTESNFNMTQEAILPIANLAPTISVCNSVANSVANSVVNSVSNNATTNISNNMANARPLALPSVPTVPPYHSGYSAPMGNAPHSSWANPSMSSFSQYPGIQPMHQQWVPPHTNPLMAGTWPCPGMMPYRCMMPYRHGMPNMNSSSSVYSTLRGGRGRMGYQPNVISGAPRMGGCMPFGYGTTRHLHQNLMPVHPAAKMPDGGGCEMLGPRYARAMKTNPSTSIRTLFTKDIGMGLTADDSISKTAELENSVADEIEEDSFNCQSLSENSFPQNSENSSLPTDSLPHDKKISQLECSLVDLLRKCSHALEKQADQLATSLDGHPPALQHTQRREQVPRRLEGDASVASVPAVTRASRIRNADDPLELLRQTRIRQQDREVSRVRLPGPKLHPRRSKVVAGYGRRKQSEH